MNRRRAGLWGVLVGCGLGAGGCGNLLGLDAFEDAPVAGAGGAAATSTSSTGQGTTTGTGGTGAASSTSGPGGGGGHGGGPLCSPGDTVACYSGPSGTEGLGVCAPGQATCLLDGSGYGDCEGDTVPVVEDCATPEDEDCTGASNESCPCTPGDVASCYGGPGGTEGVGLCVAGQQTCDASGLGYGTCLGEVQPAAADDCDALGDEDCDGYACSEPIWVQSFPGTVSQLSVAGDSAGGVYVAGRFTATLQLPGMNLIPSGAEDVFIFRLNPDGSLAWAKSFGDASGHGGPQPIASNAAGEVAIAVALSGSYAMGGGVLSTAGASDFAVAKFDSAGNHLWSKRFGDASAQTPLAVAVGATGDVFVAGEMAGSMTFSGTLTSAGGKDIVIARLAALDGSPLWGKSFGDASNQGARAIALDPAGNLYVVGTTDGNLAFPSVVQVTGSGDGFVARFDGAGNNSCASLVDFSGGGTVWGVSTTSLGDAILAGDFSSTAMIGGASGKSLTSSGLADLFWASMSPQCLTLSAAAFSGQNNETEARLIVDQNDELHVMARTAGALDLGNGPLMTAGSYDIASARLTQSGQAVWSRIYGTVGLEAGAVLGVTRGVERIVAIPTQAPLDLGTGPLPAGLTVALFAP